MGDSASLSSADTLAVATTSVFGQQLLTYRRNRQFPLTTGLLRNELQLFVSIDALKRGSGPLLSFQPNRLHFLKKNTPLHTVFRHHNGQKSDFCKVYYKILENNLTCHVLRFVWGVNIVVYNNGIKAHSDTIYNGTKVRLYGASGGASTFGSNSMRIYALNDSSPTLVDFVGKEGFPGAIVKDLRLHAHPGACLMYDCVMNQQRNQLLNLLAKESPVVSVPISSFVDSGGERMHGMKIEGTIRVFESVANENDEGNASSAESAGSRKEDEDEIATDSLVLATVMAIFVEQEMQKMRGNLK